MKKNDFTNNTTSTDNVVISRAQYEKFLALEDTLKAAESRVNWLEQMLGYYKKALMAQRVKKSAKSLKSCDMDPQYWTPSIGGPYQL